MLTEGFFLCCEFGKSSPCFATHSQKCCDCGWQKEKQTLLSQIFAAVYVSQLCRPICSSCHLPIALAGEHLEGEPS